MTAVEPLIFAAEPTWIVMGLVVGEVLRRLIGAVRPSDGRVTVMGPLEASMKTTLSVETGVYDFCIVGYVGTTTSGMAAKARTMA